MRILVTGGAGFIGCNFIRYEIANYDDTIICVDSLTYAGSLNNLKDVADNKNFKFIKADITDEQAIDDIFKEYNPDIVVNFAAESHVDNSINNPNIFTKTNIFGTQVLMNACLKYKVKRFHQVSTDEVYGDLPLNSEKWCIESAHIKPSSPYAVSKAAADLLALSYKRTYGLPITISRSSNNYGPYQNKEKLVPNAINCLLTGKKIPLYGNGLNKREWIHVDDNCKAIDLIVRKGREGEIYNISTNEEKTNLQVARAILAKMEMGEENIEFVEDRR